MLMFKYKSFCHSILNSSYKLNTQAVINPPQILDFPSQKSHLLHLNCRNRFRIYVEDRNNWNKRKKDSNGLPLGESNDVEEGEVKNEPPRFNFRLTDLVDSDPDNIVAVGLTGLLTWASVQVLWQMFVISIVILITALKYTLVAALLIFILITLL